MSPLSRFAKVKSFSVEFTMSSSKQGEKLLGLEGVDEGYVWCIKKQKLSEGGEQLTVLARAREELVGSGPSALIMSVMNSPFWRVSPGGDI